MQSCISSIATESVHGLVEHQSVDSVTKVLIIDGHPSAILWHLRRGFLAEADQAEIARTGAAALDSIQRSPPDLILMDSKLPDRSTVDIRRAIRCLYPRIPLIVVTADRTGDDAIRAIKEGACDFLFKPLEEQQFQCVITAALRVATQMRWAKPASTLPLESEAASYICGQCAMMREVYKSIGLVAGQDVNVLITGESGTGKEVVARAIHRHSTRCDAPFLALNCAAIPEHLLESELFGHEKGAFSGADRRRIGKFEQCNGGTILLDEIGDMPLSLQAKILRLIQEQEFERVGGNESIKTNVRLIASTHRDLKTWSAEDKFRADLYYRLSVFTIHLPPVRDRGHDIPVLLQHLVRRFSRELQRDVQTIDPQALELLQSYPWPGNIREMQSVLKQSLLKAIGDVLLPEFLPESLYRPNVPPGPSTRWRDLELNLMIRERLVPGANDMYAQVHRDVDLVFLTRVLDYSRGNQRKAARLLGIARQTLRGKLRELGLQLPDSVELNDETNVHSLAVD